MPYILFSEQEKQSANASDIRSFLASLGQEVKRSGREYTWESPSGKVSINGSEWYSQYERVGGGAVSFVQKFFGASYPDAVRSLLGSCAGQIPSEQSNTFRQSRSKETQTELVLPERSTDMRRLYGYLLNERCLDRDVVYAFIHAGMLYEDALNHNAVFVGTDENGKPRHIQKRSTNPQSDYKGNVTGSDIAYAFHHVGTSDRLYVFEAPIDMMAYISMNKQGWERHSYRYCLQKGECVVKVKYCYLYCHNSRSLFHLMFAHLQQAPTADAFWQVRILRTYQNYDLFILNTEFFVPGLFRYMTDCSA